MSNPLPRIPLIEDLTKGPLPPGTNLMVEYDSASEWYPASLTIAAGWLKTGGRMGYTTAAQTPTSIRAQFKRVGINAQELEGQSRLLIWDWYSSTIGQKSVEKISVDSLKIAQLSIEYAKLMKETSGLFQKPELLMSPEWLRIIDDVSCLDRFNDEKTWVEFVLSRLIPAGPLWQSPSIRGFLCGAHNDWVYKKLESAFDGIIDFRFDDTGEVPRNLVRIRRMRNLHFNPKWHQLKTSENFEVTIEK